jgi:CubicO group peptidase (beta-lactamase class C family)
LLWSVSKTMKALAFLTLVERRHVDLDVPAAMHSPDFAARRKDGVLVRQLLGHTSGLPGWTAATHDTITGAAHCFAGHEPDVAARAWARLSLCTEPR